MKTKGKRTTTIRAREDRKGFYGALKRNLKLSDAKAAAAYNRAVRITAERLYMTKADTRRFLDSAIGRHLAEACSAIASLEKALAGCCRPFGRDILRYRDMAVNVTDADFYPTTPLRRRKQ